MVELSSLLTIADRRRAAAWLHFLSKQASGYVVALLSVAIAFAARFFLEPLLSQQAPFLLFVPAVLISSLHGGLGPGLLATLLIVLIGLSFVSGALVLTTSEMINGLIFVSLEEASLGG